MKRGIALITLLLLGGCQLRHDDDDASAGPFPSAQRPVAPIVSAKWSDEDSRDKLNEAAEVMNRANIAPGMTVADIGAGEGYYTLRLAARVGEKGRVVAEDIVPAVKDILAERVNRERLDNVSVKLGVPADARLPKGSFDRIFMVHMYHEIAAPYEFLWRLRPSLKKGGQVIVVDADRPTPLHGTPTALLGCEFAAVGYRLVDLQKMPNAGGYVAIFQPEGDRPAPKDIKACSLG
jgi:ubiquinone/menaquinone biosynthesis C-methylase UbiE